MATPAAPGASEGPASLQDLPEVVIVGGGFAGLEAARQLGRAGVPTVLVDRTNHHLFQPLLYQVATAALAATDVAEPIRKILRRYPSVEVIYGDVTRIDTVARTIGLADGRQRAYGRLVLAAGSRPWYFGNEGWRAHAPGLKTAEDARQIRSRLLLSFEQAEQAMDPEERQRLMTFVVIGGGPTGVELAGSIAELSRFTLARDFRHIAPEQARVILVEAGPRLLPSFAVSLSDYTRSRLERLGVVVRTNEAVKEIGPAGVRLGDETIRAGFTLWAAGVRSSDLGGCLGVPLDRAGRVGVAPDLSVPGLPGVYVLGDLAHLDGPDGKPLPGLAQVAAQQGTHLGRHLARHLRKGTPLPPFVYRSRGNTAIIGRHAAVYELGTWHVRGWLAWVAWAIAHVYLLIGFEKRLSVALKWTARYLSYERGSRLISGTGLLPGAGSPPAAGPVAPDRSPVVARDHAQDR
ncbi:NAD(P)/FAD-dependent oxidoreductase [Methylobrevis pamukkalensis]|nr:NAD(P)/FAD-dependent oxidoreductase [Methylobrevis pamukkalensis]